MNLILDELIALKPTQNAGVEAVAGRYRSDATGTDVTIYRAAEVPRLTTIGRFGSAEYRLECLADDIWRAKSVSAMGWGGILSLDGQGGGFHLSTSRTRSMTFRRKAS